MIERYVRAYRADAIASDHFLNNIISYLIGEFRKGMREFSTEVFESIPRELEGSFRVMLQSDAKNFARAFVCDFNDHAECAAAEQMVNEALAHLQSEFAKCSSS